MKRSISWNQIWTSFIIIAILFVATLGIAKHEAKLRLLSYEQSNQVTCEYCGGVISK